MTQPPWGSPQQPWQPPGPPVPQPPRPGWPAQQGWASPPQPAWQAAPAWGTPPAPPPRRGGLSAVVLGVAVAVGLGFFAFAAATFYLSLRPAVAPPGTTSPPPSSPAATTAPPPSPVEPSPSGEPTPNPPATDDYDPPELPWPSDLDEARQWLQANALYAGRTDRIDCAIQRFEDPTPPAQTTTLDEHLNRTADCLAAVWAEPAVAAGFLLPQPPVRAYDEQITTACGTSPAMDYAAAFYCAGDQRIYYGMPRAYRLFQSTSLEIDGVLAHEFGHAVQARIGILSAEAVLSHRAATEDEVLENSRRIEVQADCLAGMSVSSVAEASGVTEQERAILRRDRSLRGDREGRPRDHGAPEIRQHWFDTGLGTSEIGRCDTFSAPAEDVK